MPACLWDRRFFIDKVQGPSTSANLQGMGPQKWRTRWWRFHWQARWLQSELWPWCSISSSSLGSHLCLKGESSGQGEARTEERKETDPLTCRTPGSQDQEGPSLLQRQKLNFQFRLRVRSVGRQHGLCPHLLFSLFPESPLLEFGIFPWSSRIDSFLKFSIGG